MVDSRFHKRFGPFSCDQLARLAGARLQNGDGDKLIMDVAPLDRAGPDELSFIDNRKYRDQFHQSRAGLCVVHPKLADHAPEGMALLVTSTPYKAYALTAQAFYPMITATGQVHPAAVIDSTARLDPSCDVSAGAVIGADVEIGPGCRIGANVVIGDGVVIGANCVIGPCASLSHCQLGDRVYLYAGTRIGQDGFGFAMDPEQYVRVPQLGRVLIEDDVEVGANSTIDRGAGSDTVIGRGTMIDNLVQIGHNAQLGAGCVIVSQAGVSGSAKLGHHVVLAAQAGIAGHLDIGDMVRIGGQSGVMRNIAAGEEVIGSPAIPSRQQFRQIVALARLAKNRK